MRSFIKTVKEILTINREGMARLIFIKNQSARFSTNISRTVFEFFKSFQDFWVQRGQKNLHFSNYKEAAWLNGKTN